MFLYFEIERKKIYGIIHQEPKIFISIAVSNLALKSTDAAQFMTIFISLIRVDLSYSFIANVGYNRSPDYSF